MIATRILRHARVLIVGCGDVGMRTLPLFQASAAAPRVIALTHHPERADELRAAGALPIPGDLDARNSLRRLSGIAHSVLHLAPPRDGLADTRTCALIATLRAPRHSVARGGTQAAVMRQRTARAYLRGYASDTARGLRDPSRDSGKNAGRSGPKTPFIVPCRLFAARKRRAVLRFAYASTTGVYGDCDGALIDETRPVRPDNERARRRVSAETQLRAAGARGAGRARSNWHVSIARIPGIYAGNRLPLARIEKTMPALIAQDDVYTNHIHADDLAAILIRMLARASAADHQRIRRH